MSGMYDKLQKVLNKEHGNYIFPFLWMCGNDEKTIRRYVQAIDEANMKALCVESRPHPDFCGERWWQDMDIVLDEVKKREMKMWILDDEHFPTGYAGGTIRKKPDELRRQSVCCRIYEVKSGEILYAGLEQVLHPDAVEPSEIEKILTGIMYYEPDKIFDDDRLLGFYAVRQDQAEEKDLTNLIKDNELTWYCSEGDWKVYAMHLTRNAGPHRDYINMMDKDSCRVLIDAVYEPHYERYKEEFGKTIMGFFSDEPELGNGHLYDSLCTLGKNLDYPWSRELEKLLLELWGDKFLSNLTLLWENQANPEQTANIRYEYMNFVTRLVQKHFSEQIGEWCREHGVEYIGHLIEDNNQHSQTGSSLGHYFRALRGQDMAGIDVVSGQVYPQGEEQTETSAFGTRNGEFFHYMLGKLGDSMASIDPLKKGRTMCEIYGNYGWSTGVRLEKYILDHLLVRGSNHFVPHAFCPREFPDWENPPHFYAHGNNPQYRHFGQLMDYGNRMSELLTDGYCPSDVAVLYHAEGEWMGKAMCSHRIGRILTDAQIEYDYIPLDVLEEAGYYQTCLKNGRLCVNTQKYKVLIIPEMEYIPAVLEEWMDDIEVSGIQMIFVNKKPINLKREKSGVVLQEGEIREKLLLAGVSHLELDPLNDRLRYRRYVHQDENAVILLINEGKEIYKGNIAADSGYEYVYRYDGWENKLYKMDYEEGEKQVSVCVEPMKSVCLIQSHKELSAEVERAVGNKKIISFAGKWKRSICRSIDYPLFQQEKEIRLPDYLAEEEPYFSGIVRYENAFHAKCGQQIYLEITDAYEGVEVLLNEKSLGIQVVPPFIYNMKDGIKEGENHLRIEVATTLEREMALRDEIPKEEITCGSGITGEVYMVVIG